MTINLDVFSFAQIQGLAHLLQMLEAGGVDSLPAARRLLDDHTHHRRLALRREDVVTRKNNLRHCPACHLGGMTRSAVNTTLANQVAGDYTAVWICGRCRHEEWVK